MFHKMRCKIHGVKDVSQDSSKEFHQRFDRETIDRM